MENRRWPGVGVFLQRLFRRRETTVGVGLAVLTLAVFGQSAGFPFINYDDSDYVVSNPMVSKGLTWKGVAWAFSGFHSSNWHPLTWISHMLDCQWYGLNPAGHHLTSVFLHVATVVGFFLVLRGATGSLWRSAFVAAVFAIHPLRAESVVWISERKDVLSGLFFVLTMGAYVRFTRMPESKSAYAWVAAFFALGLLCKPMLVSVPLVLLILDFWPLEREESFRRLVLEKVPLAAMAAAVAVVTIFAQQGGLEVGQVYSFGARLGNALISSVVYLFQFFWPSGLAVLYPWPKAGWSAGAVLVAAIIFIDIWAVVIWQRWRRPWLLAGWLWYLVMLVPVIGLVQVGPQAHADRYTYLPLLGICVALVWTVAEGLAERPRANWILGTLAVVSLGLLVPLGLRQVGYWSSSERLWTHTVQSTEENYRADYALGNAYAIAGNPEDAITRYQAALVLKPDFSDAHSGIGEALMNEVHPRKAVPYFEAAIKYSPTNAGYRVNLGVARQWAGQLDEAISDFREALRLDSKSAVAHFDLARTFESKGLRKEAMEEYRAALRLQPDYADAAASLKALESAPTAPAAPPRAP